MSIYPVKIKTNIVGKIAHMYESRTKPDETTYCLSTLRVYDHTEFPINPTLATYKYLGVHIDLRCKNNDAFDREKKKSSSQTVPSPTQAILPHAKIAYMQFKIMLIILYTA
jgi:hypothetical protein